MINQSFLNNYFSTSWNVNPAQYIYSGYAILNKINDDDMVLDVGCGYHPFKGKLKNIIGIDPANNAADILTTIEDYIPDRLFDVAICFGSINFGDDSIIEKQISKVNSCLKNKARIFWRCNPGLHDHKNEECKQIEFYPWTFERLNEYAKMHGFIQKNSAMDTNKNNIRLYTEWHRN